MRAARAEHDRLSGAARSSRFRWMAGKRVPNRKVAAVVTTSGNVAPEERLAYSVDEAAQITGLSRDLLYDQMRAGKLAYLKIGRRRLISRRSLEAFLAQATAT